MLLIYGIFYRNTQEEKALCRPVSFDSQLNKCLTKSDRKVILITKLWMELQQILTLRRT